MLCPQNAPNQTPYARVVLCHRALEGSSLGIRVAAALFRQRCGTPSQFPLANSDRQRCGKPALNEGRRIKPGILAYPTSDLSIRMMKRPYEEQIVS